MRICSISLVICLAVAGCGQSVVDNESGSKEPSVDRQQSPVSDVVLPDEEAIIGFWKVVDGSADGDPYPEAIGKIYEFRRDNKLRFVSRENEGVEEYRIDVQARPKTLVSWFFNPKNASFGIYELNRDALRWRFTLDKQDLQFSEIPQRSWWEYTLIRVTADDAERAIEALQEKRLHNEH